MTIRQHLDRLLAALPEDRLSQVADFASYLRWLDEQEKQEQREWAEFGLQQLSKAYGAEEPEYSEADIKSGHKP